MKLETDISKIEILSQEQEDANWRFRCFMKGCDLEIEQIDEIVHKLNENVSAQIDCLKCGNCCKVISPILLDSDIERLAIFFSIPDKTFISEYLNEADDEEGYAFNEKPCPFLDSDNSCTVYSSRPENCRSYPHLHKDDFIFRISQAYSNCSVCPIVYNVYEMLKVEMQNRNVKSLFRDYD